MSKSYKKHPFYKAKYRYGKMLANERVRNRENIPNGKAYRKFYPRWDVIDHIGYEPWNNGINYYTEHYESVSKARQEWEKWFYRK